MDWPRWIERLRQRSGGKPRSHWAQLMAVLNDAGIEHVIDVGANRGQYARSLRRHGFAGNIISFEPLPQPHAELVQLAAKDALWQIAPRMALGDQEDVIGFDMSAEDDMSSALAQTELLERISPTSKVLDRIEVPQRRLDDVVAPLGVPMHLKIDVQGYESAVLDGAATTLAQLETLQLEMALVRLYEGERLWREMVDRLDASGFDLVLLIPGYFDKQMVRQLQVDGVFRRRPAGAG